MKRSACRVCADVPEVEIPAGVAEGEGFVASAVVGHEAGDPDAEAFVVGERGFEEGDGAFFPLSFVSSGMTLAKTTREASSTQT